MDKKNVLNSTKDTSLYSNPKVVDPKNTKVFVLPPELLKGLLLENKIPKLNLLNKNEISPVVDSTKNAQDIIKNISNEVKVQKSTNSVGDINKTADSTKVVAEKLNTENQLQNGTLNKSTENVKELSFKNDQETINFNEDIHTKMLSKNSGIGKKKLDRDKELKEIEICNRDIDCFSEDEDLKLQKSNQNTPIRVYERKSKNKVIKNFSTNDIRKNCDSICNKESAESTSDSRCISVICKEEKDQENTVHNVVNIDMKSSTKNYKLTNPVAYLSNEDTNSVIVFDENLQMKNSILKETQFNEESETKSLPLSSEQNIKIKEEIVSDYDEKGVTDEVIIIEEIEEIIEFDDSCTEDSTITENNTINSLVIKEGFENINIVTDESKINEQQISNKVYEVSKAIQNKVHENFINALESEKCNESLNLEEISEIAAKKESHDSNNVETKLIENPVSAVEQNILSVTLPSENVSLMKPLNFNDQSDLVLEEIKSLEKKEIPLFVNNKVKTKKETKSTENLEVSTKEISLLDNNKVESKQTESTENLELSTKEIENNDSSSGPSRRSTRISLKRYKPVINNCKRKQRNCKSKDDKKSVDDLNVENDITNELLLNKEMVNDEKNISHTKNLKQPIFSEKNKTKIIFGDVDSKIENMKVNEKILPSAEPSRIPRKDTNKKSVEKDIDDKNSPKEMHTNNNIFSKSGQYLDSADKSISECKTSSVPLDISQDKVVLSERTINENYQKILNDEILFSGQQNIFNESNQNSTVNEETSKMISETGKQKTKDILILEDIKPVDNKCDSSNKVDQEIHDVAESQNDNDEVEKNLFVDIPVNNDALLGISHNDAINQELNGPNLTESLGNSKETEEILNYIKENNLNSDISHDEKMIKDNIIYSAEEKIINENNESSNVDGKIPKMTLKVKKQEVFKTLENTETVSSKSNFSNTLTQETYNVAESQNDTDEVKESPTVNVSVNNELKDSSQEVNDHILIKSFGKTKETEEIINDKIDKNLKSHVSNEKILKVNVTCSAEEQIWDENNDKSTLNEEIPKTAEVEKEEITKMETNLIDETYENVLKASKDMENIDSESDFSDTFDQESYDIAESQRDTDEIIENPVVDVPMNCNVLSDTAQDVTINQEINDNNLIESSEKSKEIEQMSNDATNNDLTSDLSHNENHEKVLEDNAVCSAEEKISDKSNKNSVVNKEIPKSICKIEKQELINENIATVSQNLEDADIVNTESDFSEAIDKNKCDVEKPQSSTDEIKETPVFDVSVINNELSDPTSYRDPNQEVKNLNSINSFGENKQITEIINNATKNDVISDISDSNEVKTSKSKRNKDSSKTRSKNTAKSNCDLKMNTRRSSRLSSVDTTGQINSETSCIYDTTTELIDSSCKKDVNLIEVANQKTIDTITDIDTQQVNETPNVPKKKGRRGRIPKSAKNLEQNSEKSTESNDVNKDVNNQINEVTVTQKRTRRSRFNLSQCDSSEVKEGNSHLNLSTNDLLDNSEQNLNISNKSVEPTVTQKKKRGRIAKSNTLNHDSSIVHCENDLNIDTTKSDVNSVQRRSRRSTSVKSTTETRTKYITRNNDKSAKETKLLKDTENNALDTKEVHTRRRSTRSKSKTSESNVLEEKLDEKIKIEHENLSEKEESNSNCLLKMDNSNKDNSDIKDNTETVNNVEDKEIPNLHNQLKMDNSNEDNSNIKNNTEAVNNAEDQVEKEIPNLNNVQKKRKGRPRKSSILKTDVASDVNTGNKPNSTSNLIKSKPDELSDNQSVDEDFVNSRKRTRRSRFDKSTEIDSQDDLETSINKSTFSRKRKRQSRFDKSIVNDSQEDFETSKDLSEYEKEISTESENNDETNNYIRPRRKQRKTGRPKGSRTLSRKPDDDYTPHHSYTPAKEKNKKISKTSDNPEAQQTVTCGKCGRSLTKNQWAHHNLGTHNNLGWLEGTPKPDYENDEKLVKRILAIVIKRRKSLICEKCSAVQRSVAGHLSHVLFCGKDEEEARALMVTCPVCKAVCKPTSLEYHERIHKVQADEKQKTVVEIDEVSGVRVKRKAAEKAVTKISEFAETVKADQEEGIFPPDKKIKLNSFKKFIQRPRVGKTISGALIKKWTKCIEAGEDAACSQAGCTFSAKSMDEIKRHYSSCNFTPQENFVCKICKYQTKSKNDIFQHAVQNHPVEDEDGNASISGSNSSSESDFDDSVDKTHGSSKGSSFVESNDPSNKMFKFLFKDGICYMKYNKTFCTAFQWTLDYEEKNYSFHLFDDYTPNAFQLLKEEESKQYLPELKQSMPVTSFQKKDENTEWKRWKTFEGQCFDDHPTFFAGGPVWALAWLPIPSFLSLSDDIIQFVAVSTHPTMDKEYSVGETYSGKNIIQIWDIGDLNHNVNIESAPKLAYAIAHDGGTVWCLEWCPSGCYDHKDLPGFEEKENQLRRMGLLAAACSDGCIRVYSLIFPEDRPSSKTNKDEETDECLIYKTDPVIMLVVNRKIFDNKQQNWQVTKLSWTKEHGHNVIVGGFSNGYVALWDLTTKSPMLKCKRDNTVFLNPYKHFLAHQHAVTMVYLIPHENKRYLMTTSLDRHYKFWDLEDITNPRTNVKKSYVTDAAWLNHWNCVLLSYDDALSMGHNYTYCWPLREYTYRHYNILPTNSTSFTVDTSDFGNSIANGTMAGEVLTLFPQQLMYIRDMDKRIPLKRYYSIVSSVEVVDFQESSNKEENDETEQEKYRFMPSTYEDSKDRFGLKFCDKLNQFREGNSKARGSNPKKTLTCESMQAVPVEQYPFMSVNRVSWNSNSWSFLWLAVGYQNGFVRFISFKSLASTNEWNKLLTNHIKRLKAKCENVDVDR